MELFSIVELRICYNHQTNFIYIYILFMGVERLALKETIGLLTRNPTMVRRHVIGLYLMSLKDCEVGSVARSSYFFLRHVDDVLDGDLKLDVDPFAYVSSLRSQIETGEFSEKPEIIKLVEYALPVLNKKAQSGDNPKQDFLDLIDAMVFDNQRLKERRPLTSEQLKEYYQQTFFPLHNIMLIGLGSSSRACDIPEMSFCQGRVYSVRDIEADWNKGIINVPSEILSDAGLTNNSTFLEVTESDVVKKWFKTELQACRGELEMLQTRFNESPKTLTSRIYNTLIRSMLRFIETHS